MTDNPQGFTAEEAAAMDAMKADAPMEMDAPTEPTAETPPETPAEAPETPSEPVQASDPTPEKPPQGYVPHGAMHAEREKARQAQSELAQLRAEMAAMKVASEQQPEPEQIPDPVLNPAEYSAWVKAQAAQPVEQVQQLQQQLAQYQEQQALTAALTSDATAFATTTPDYQAAETHLVNARIQELQMVYPTADPAQVAAHVAQEKLGLVKQAQQAGMRPAEFIYNIATHRGYAAPQPATPPMAAQQLQAQATAAAQTQSLATAPANAGAGDLTMESIAKMTPTQFAKIKAERGDDLRRVMQGG